MTDEPHMTLPNGDIIRVGGYGKTRDGRKVGPMEYDAQVAWPWEDGSGVSRTENGFFWGSGNEAADDIIAAWPEGPGLSPHPEADDEPAGVTFVSREDFIAACEVSSDDIEAAHLSETVDPVNHVNHPPHYVAHPSGIECIQITEHMGFCLGNAVKYIWRADMKGDAVQDLEKARWYIEREISLRKRDAAS